MQEFINLAVKFEKISEKGFIKGVNNSTNAVGYTFEKLLNKNADSMFFPDYLGIEIKCSQRYSRYPLSLFSLAFDGPYLYETNRILQLYGKNDYCFHDKKTLIVELKVGKKILVNDKYFFELHLDYADKRMYLCVYNENKSLIEKISYIDFDTIKNRLQLKLNKLALIYASKKEIDNNKYFRYYQLTLYKLKDFDTFLELLKDNTITAVLSCRVSRSGEETGRQRNKNLVFQIKKENLNYLFDEVYYINKDNI